MTEKVTLIAEVASNAGGNLRTAKTFIERFTEAGANIIKFQLTRYRRLDIHDPQREWMKQAEWSPWQIDEILGSCVTQCVIPMFTIYHPDDVHELEHKVPFVKIGAGEAHSGDMAARILEAPFTRIYVSEGIRPVHASYRADGRVCILGTCSHYPAPHGMVASRFTSGRYDGWSDHCVGLDESVHAVILGATTIERHVQHPHQARPAKPFESTVEEFAELRRRVDENPDRFLGRWNHYEKGVTDV